MNTQIKLARQAFDALAFLNNQTWSSHREKLLALCKSEEKSHRGFMSDFNGSHTSDTASVSDCAKLFAVKRIAKYLNGEAMPKGQDFLHFQTSCFYAAGLVDEYKNQILNAWAEFDLNALANHVARRCRFYVSNNLRSIE